MKSLTAKRKAKTEKPVAKRSFLLNAAGRVRLHRTITPTGLVRRGDSIRSSFVGEFTYKRLTQKQIARQYTDDYVADLLRRANLSKYANFPYSIDALEGGAS